MTTWFTVIPSPIDDLLLMTDGRALTGLHMAPHTIGPDLDRDDEHPVLVEAAEQLTTWFAGGRLDFDLDLAPAGTEFQRHVWSELCRIDYGETISYGELARRVGRPGAARAVGLANGRNPISIIVPCHRVIGADGSLTGYGGGIARKRRLLDLEARLAGGRLPI
jgi:methylated-DNA-[protein]-cysteine S-methyltransferase